MFGNLGEPNRNTSESIGALEGGTQKVRVFKPETLEQLAALDKYAEGRNNYELFVKKNGDWLSVDDNYKSLKPGDVFLLKREE